MFYPCPPIFGSLEEVWKLKEGFGLDLNKLGLS